MLEFFSRELTRGSVLVAVVLGCNGAVDPAPPAVASVAVTPASASVVVGATTQLTATPKDGSGNALAERTVTWGSSSEAVATISTSGLVRGVAAGTATVTAACEGKSGSATITVTPVPVASVAVTPASASVVAGATTELTATPKDGSGNALAGRAITWASSSEAVATVSTSGLVTGVAAGTATITAASEGKSGTAGVRVVAPVMPVSPNASATAISVLSYLADLKNRPDNRVVSGQYVANTTSGPLLWAWYYDSVREVTGLDVGLLGLDVEGEGWCALRDPREYCAGKNTGVNFDPWWMAQAKRHWQNGGLVALHWNAHNPWTGGVVDDTSRSGGTVLDQLITPGSPLYDRWIARLDSVADGLSQLRDAGIVVLWRPFPEMNGPNFWWGSLNAPASFKRLWQHMFDYFTKTKHLTNLLWVYAPVDWRNPMDQYPGAAHVDIVGFSFYPRNALQSGQESYDALAASGKVMAMTEYGYAGSDPKGDNLAVINAIQARMPLLSYVLFWNDLGNQGYSIAANLNASAFMHHPWILDRSELQAH